MLLESNSRVNYNTIHRCSAILSDGFNLDVLDADDALQIDFGCRTAAASHDLNVECRPLWALGYLVCTCSALSHHRRKLLSYRRSSSCPGRAAANSSIHRGQSGRFFFFIAPRERTSMRRDGEGRETLHSIASIQRPWRTTPLILDVWLHFREVAIGCRSSAGGADDKSRVDMRSWACNVRLIVS